MSTVKPIARGLTLVELMVVVAVIAIIAGIAWPAYHGQMVKQNRSEAVIALGKASNELERCGANNNQDFSGCSVSSKITSGLDHYKLTTSVTTSAFTVTATPIGGQAADDKDCTALTLNNVGVKGGTSSNPALNTQAKIVKSCWSQ